MTIEIGVLIALIGCAVSVGTFFIGRTTAAKQTGVADGELRADIKYIKTTVEKQDTKLGDVVENYEEVKLEIVRLKGRLEKLEKIVEMYHNGGNI